MDFLPLAARQAAKVLLCYFLFCTHLNNKGTGSKHWHLRSHVPVGQIIQDQDGQKHNTMVLIL